MNKVRVRVENSEVKSRERIAYACDELLVLVARRIEMCVHCGVGGLERREQ